jgi:hypothetical protein
MYNPNPLTSEQIPKTSPPSVWLGFLFPAAFFFTEILFVALELDEKAVAAFLQLLMVGGGFYWLVCVYKIHQVLRELTRGSYPFSPIGATLRHIVPLFNIYWVFKWPSELSNYLTTKGRVQMISGSLLGLLLLLSMLLRWVDGAIAMGVTFGVTMYLSNKLREHVTGMKGVTVDQLPPLPDPNMFSRPIQSRPGQVVAEDWRGR